MLKIIGDIRVLDIWDNIKTVYIVTTMTAPNCFIVSMLQTFLFEKQSDHKLS